eukprot:3047861-Rhodomonas_salina.1
MESCERWLVFTDILHMPLPGDPTTMLIDSNFDSLTDLEISSSGVPDLNANDVHPAIMQSLHVADSSQSNINVTQLRGGCIVNSWGSEAARRDCFAPPVLELGQPLMHWWDCESKEISLVLDSELGAYWQGDQCEYNAESLDMDLDSSFPGQLVLKCLLSVCKGKAFPKKSKAQIACIPICKPSAGPDVSVCNAIKL